jgi:hypothetical protein
VALQCQVSPLRPLRANLEANTIEFIDEELYGLVALKEVKKKYLGAL